MTVIFVLNVNIPDLTFLGVLRTPPPGPLLSSCPLSACDSCVLTRDSPIPVPAPKTGDFVNLAAFRLLKGTVHSTRVLTLKRFVKFGSSIRCIFPPFNL